jgi:hypothetical protein
MVNGGDSELTIPPPAPIRAGWPAVGGGYGYGS